MWHDERFGAGDVDQPVRCGGGDQGQRGTTAVRGARVMDDHDLGAVGRPIRIPQVAHPRRRGPWHASVNGNRINVVLTRLRVAGKNERAPIGGPAWEEWNQTG